MIKELTWFNEIQKCFLNKNLFMIAYILLKFWFKVYWGLSSGVIMVLHQNQQKLTQEDADVSYIPFLQPVIRLKAVGVQEKSKESWKQFLL